MKILMIDDEYERFNNFGKALIDLEIKSMEKGFFSNETIYQYIADDEKNNEAYCKHIETLAKETEIFKLYEYIFKVIEDEDIDIVFIDLYLCENEDSNHPTGIKLALKLRSNKLHEKLPLVLHSRNISEIKQIYQIDKQILAGNTEFLSTENETNYPKMLREKIFKDKYEMYLTYIGDYRKREYRYNLAIINALRKEQEGVLEFVELPQEENDEKRKIVKCGTDASGKGGSPCHYGYMINEKEKVILKVLMRYEKDYKSIHGRYGASVTQKTVHNVLYDCKPEYVVMTGVMAGYKKKVKLGDLIFALKAYKDTSPRGALETEIIEDSKDCDGCENEIDEFKTFYPDDDVLNYAVKKYLDSYDGNDDQDLNEAVFRKYIENLNDKHLMMAVKNHYVEIKNEKQKAKIINKEYKKDDDKIFNMKIQKYIESFFGQSPILSIFDDNTKKQIVEKNYREFIINNENGEDQQFSINSNSVLSRNGVLNSQEIFTSIVEKTPDIIGIEMEIHAMYSAVKGSSTKAIALKSVVDYADGEKNKAWQKLGSYTSAQVMYTFFTEIVYSKKGSKK